MHKVTRKLLLLSFLFLETKKLLLMLLKVQKIEFSGCENSDDDEEIESSNDEKSDGEYESNKEPESSHSVDAEECIASFSSER